jgi:hypothetical protein
MKTACALWAAEWLMQLGAIRRVLILAPLSTLVDVWGQHIWMMFPRRRSYTVLYGNRDKRYRLLKQHSDFYILNHDGLKLFMEYTGGVVRGDPRRCTPTSEFAEFLKEIDLVIVDEGVIYRNYQTDLWLAARALLIYPHNHKKHGQPNRLGCWWMSGNLTPNAPTDAWAQARCVLPRNVSSWYTQFREQTMRKMSTFKWVPRKGWEKIVFGMLQPSVCYRRTDVLKDLPPEIWEVRSYELTKQQRDVEKALLEQLYAEIREGQEITALNEGAKRVKLLQVYAGAAYLDDRSVIRFDCKPKLSALKSIKEEAGQLIVFTPFKHTQKFLREEMEKWGYTVGLVNGDVSAGKRTKIFQAFQKTHEIDILLAHPECMAHGLNLAASHVIVWWSPIDDFDIFDQANGRIKRPDQRFPQVVIYLVGSELEREIYRRLKSKEKMSGLLFDLLRNRGYKV